MYDEYGEFEYGKYGIKFYKDDNYNDKEKIEIEEHVKELLEYEKKESIEELSNLDMYFRMSDDECCKKSDCPICRACKNSIINEKNNWGDFNNCKIYGNAPNKYAFDCENKDCPDFIIDKKSIFYEIIENKINS